MQNEMRQRWLCKIKGELRSRCSIVQQRILHNISHSVVHCIGSHSRSSLRHPACCARAAAQQRLHQRAGEQCVCCAGCRSLQTVQHGSTDCKRVGNGLCN